MLTGMATSQLSQDKYNTLVFRGLAIATVCYTMNRNGVCWEMYTVLLVLLILWHKPLERAKMPMTSRQCHFFGYKT